MSQSQLSAAAPSNDRPIFDEAKRKTIIAVVGSLASAAVTFGFFTPELATRVNDTVAYILGAVVTLLPLATSVLHALGIVKGSEAKTTPVDSPTDTDGTPLVPLHAADLDDPPDDEAPLHAEPAEVEVDAVDEDAPLLDDGGPSSMGSVQPADFEEETLGPRHSAP